MKEKKNYIWVEKYRPKKVDDVILPKSVKKVLKGLLNKEDLTNLLFYGNAGCGKTTCAKAICEELGMDYIFINGTSCGVDTARYSFPQFASSKSLESSKRKVIIIDEAEKMTDSFSQAFNSFIEEFSHNCAFILTTNHPNQLSSAIRSRFNDVCFDVKSKEEKKEMFLEFLNKICEILNLENINFERKVVSHFIFEYFPDMRKSLNMLQAETTNGNLDVDSLGKGGKEFDFLIELLKDKKFSKMLLYIQENEMELNNIINVFTKKYDIIDNTSLPTLIKIMNDYQYKDSFVVNKQLNLIAFLTEVMIGINFK